MQKIIRRSALIFSAIAVLSQTALASPSIRLREGEIRRIMLNDGRSILISCSRDGGRQTAAEIPLAVGRSVQIALYRESTPTLVTCEARRPLPPVPRPPLPPIPQPPTPGRGTEVVIFSNSDACSGTISGVATLQSGFDVTDQCRGQLQNIGARAWSVRVDGQCRDISDTDALSACAQTVVPQRLNDVQITIFSNSDSCSGNVSGSGILRGDLSQADQCQSLASRGNGSAWSIRIGNTCQDIADTNVLSACLGANLPNTRPTGSTDVTIYSNSDTCSGSVSASASLIPDFDLQDQCSNLTRTSSSTAAWSLKTNGRCQDIADTDVVSACLNVRVPSFQGARQVVIYSNSDACSGSVSAAGYIDPRFSTIAQCQALKQNGMRNAAWSVRVDDRCVDVQDTDIVSACIGLGL